MDCNCVHCSAGDSPGYNYSQCEHVYDIELNQVQISRQPSDLSVATGLLQFDESHTDSGQPHQGQLAKEELPRTCRQRLQGWKFGLTLNASTATVVLVVNIVLVTVAACSTKLVNGIGSLYVGDCIVADRWNTGVHVLINVLSSILLSASNYTMQCVTAPTRQDCDAAHARGDWLDIGISGTRNLGTIGFGRRTIWALLALSSVPIHLLYNSAVFKTLDANNHRYAVLSHELLDAPALNESQLTSSNRGMETTRLQYQKDPDAYERLSAEACISAYSGPFVSGHSNVLLVTFDSQYNYSVKWPPLYGTVTHDYTDVHTGPLNSGQDWLCNFHAPNGACYGSEGIVASNWTMLDYKIDYCLARTTELHCKLQFSLHIMIPVMICNLIKSACMLWTLLRQREITSVTFGDALASWLDRPDECTRHCCLMGQEKFKSSCKSRHAQSGEYESLVTDTWKSDTPQPVTFSRRGVRRWSDAVSSKRWSFTMTLCIITLIVACIFLIIALQGATSDQNPLTQLGFGSFNSRAIINIGMAQLGISGLVGCVLLANLPQTLLSVLYLAYNSLYTCMHLAHEYSRYAIERKPLRVTDPKGEQRSTYWLQLPYKYGIPLLVASTTMHWLVSRSIFLARVTVWRDGGDESPEDAMGRNNEEYVTVSAIGYSCAPMLCAILLGAAMLFAAILMGRRKLPSHMPLASSCSMAIAAAAHRPGSDINASILPVQWGVVQSSDAEAVGHACFTSEEVTELREGRLYAGQGSAQSVTQTHRRLRTV